MYSRGKLNIELVAASLSAGDDARWCMLRQSYETAAVSQGSPSQAEAGKNAKPPGLVAPRDEAACGTAGLPPSWTERNREESIRGNPARKCLYRARAGVVGRNMDIEHTLQSGGPGTAYSTCARWQRHRRQPLSRSPGHGRAQRGSDRCMRRAPGRAECRTARRPGGSGVGHASAAGTAGIGSGGGGCCPGAFRQRGIFIGIWNYFQRV